MAYPKDPSKYPPLTEDVLLKAVEAAEENLKIAFTKKWYCAGAYTFNQAAIEKQLLQANEVNSLLSTPIKYGNVPTGEFLPTPPSPGGDMSMQNAFSQKTGYSGPPSYADTCEIQEGASTVEEARTQKGKSLIALRSSASPYSCQQAHVCRTFEEAYGAFLRLTEYAKSMRVFMRPCPPRPRPGFLDSEVVAGPEDIRRIWDAMIELEPEGEVIIMPFVDAKISATFTSGLLGIGPGHEGATAGLDAIGVPVPPVDWDSHCNGGWKSRVKCSKVYDHPDAKQRFPHIESVFGTSVKRQDVQIRAGMKATGAGNWVPVDTLALTIIKGPVGNDPLIMIKWEETARKLAGKPDVVVWQPGGHQGAHTALHCKANAIPIVFDSVPPVKGIMIKATSANDEPDYQGVIDYAAAGLSVQVGMGDTREMLRTLLVLLHGYNPSGVNARWIGLAVALMLRLGQCASIGERRHQHPRKGIQCRSTLYRRSINNFWAKRSRMNEVATAYGKFDTWTKGYGGKAWLDCTVSLADLDETLLKFCRKPNRVTLGAMVSEFNICINKAHNGGWWMNKFGGEDMMDLAASGSIDQTLDCVPFLWKFTEHTRSENPSLINEGKECRKRLCRAKRLKHAGLNVVELYKKHQISKEKEHAEYLANCKASQAVAQAQLEATSKMSAEEAKKKKISFAKELKKDAKNLLKQTLIMTGNHGKGLNSQGNPLPQESTPGLQKSWCDLNLPSIQASYYSPGHLHVQIKEIGEKTKYLTFEVNFGGMGKHKRFAEMFSQEGESKFLPSYHHSHTLKYLKPTHVEITPNGIARLRFAPYTIVDLKLINIKPSKKEN